MQQVHLILQEEQCSGKKKRTKAKEGPSHCQHLPHSIIFLFYFFNARERKEKQKQTKTMLKSCTLFIETVPDRVGVKTKS
eukprot:gene11709-8056_t